MAKVNKNKPGMGAIYFYCMTIISVLLLCGKAWFGTNITWAEATFPLWGSLLLFVAVGLFVLATEGAKTVRKKGDGNGKV